MTSHYNYTVAIQCMTYNHSKYITDALNGFVMQKTDFPFVILIVDDASNDGEVEVISDYIKTNFNICQNSTAYTRETEYAYITYAQHNTNNNCFIVAMYLKYNHYQIGKKYDKLKYIAEWMDSSKYIALCEGDDYWIDPLKLQKQVDFLDSNQNVSLCFHNTRIINETSLQYNFKIIHDREYTIKEIFDEWIVPTASIMLKQSSITYTLNDNRIINGDINIILAAGHSGKIYGMSEYMSTYRIQANGATIKRVQDDNINLQFKYLEHYKCLYQEYSKIPYNSYKKKIANTFINLSASYYKRHEFLQSFRFLLLAFTTHIFQTIRQLSSIVIQKLLHK